VLVTTDKNLRYQQKLAARHLAVLILPTTSWPQLQAQQGQIVAVINALRSGEVVEMKM
jgi:nitrate reductase NapAB chaperone NapD